MICHFQKAYSFRSRNAVKVKNMSTYIKGNAFELRTKAIIEKMLCNSELELKVGGESELWVVPKSSQTFHQKSYTYTFGASTKTDISIEEPTEKDSPSYLIVIECKSYNSSHPVGIDEIQEFNTRLQDLNATKGVFVTSSSFQSGALSCAEHHNIALIRINEQNEVKWFLHRIQNGNGYAYQDFVDMFMQSEMSYSTLIVDGHFRSTSFVDYLMDLLNIEDEKLQTLIPYLNDNDIKQKTQSFLCDRQYNKIPNLVLKLYAIKQNILIDDKHACDGFLGKCDFINRKVIIDKSLMEGDMHRYRFTMAHELGHAFLQQPLLKHLVADAHDKNVLDLKNCSKWEKRLEIQANHFAAFLLMPQNPLINIYMEVKGKLNYPLESPLRMDDNATSIHDCRIMFSVLSEYFNVSKQVAMIRLLDEKLIDVGVNNPFMVDGIKSVFEK